jgi:hypothetical protein
VVVFDDIDGRALLFPLVPAHVDNQTYTRRDQTMDFRAVFFGEASAIQKERVLYQIMALCRPVARYEGVTDTNKVFFELGRREVAVQLMEILHREFPAEAQPATTQNQQGRNSI